MTTTHDLADTNKNIGWYAIDAFLGEGMMGKVYKATDTRNQQTVAIKLLKQGSASHASRLQSEFKLLGALRHPHLAEVYDYGVTEEGNPFFAMQWIDGQPLSCRHIRGAENRIESKLLAECVRQITSALRYIHSRNVFHGDLKPENILVCPNNDGLPQIKLMDFGISHSAETGGGGLSGTFEYMAPELIRGERPGAASDLYALGCVLYELVAGNPPFTGGSPLEILRQHLQTEPVTLGGSSAEAPLLQWISTLLQKDRRLRYRTPDQLYSAVCEYLGIESDEAAKETAEFPVQLIEVPRENEKAKLAEIAAAAKKSFQCVCIEGVEGMGKTHLLRDIKADLQIAGFTTYSKSVSGYQTSFSAVISLLQETLPNKLDESALEAAAVIASLFPELFPGIEPAKQSGLSSDAEILRLFHASATLLLFTGYSAILIDDLHAADELSQEFFAYFTGHASAQADLPLLLALGFDPELINRELFTPEIQEQCVTLQLQPISQDILAKNIELLFSGDLSPSFQMFVWKHSQGNPGTVERILQFCIDEGVVERTRHGWILHERPDLAPMLPASGLDRLRHKIRKLTPETLHILKAIALSPAAVTLETLEFVCSTELQNIYQQCSELIRRELAIGIDGKVLRASEDVEPLLEFENGEKERLHGRFVEYYREHPDQAPGDATLGEHYRGSAQTQAAAQCFIASSKAAERVYDYKMMYRYLAQAVDIPGAVEDDDALFGAYETLVKACNILGNREAESEYIEQLLILAGRWKGREGAVRLARAYEQQTEYYLALAEFERARKSAERALKYYEEADDPMGIGHCRQKIGFIEYRTKPNESVIVHYRKAQEIYARQQAVIEEGNILIDIGLVYYTILNNPDEALRCYDEAKTKFESVGMERGIGRAYGNMGVQYFALGDYEKALEYHTKANEIFSRIGDFRATALSALHIGRCSAAIGMYSDAIQNLEKGMKIGIALSDLYVQEHCLENLAETYIYLGQYSYAKRLFTDALAIATKTGFKTGEISNILDLAQILLVEGNIEEAIANIKQCEGMLTEITDTNIEAVCMYRLGLAYMQRGKFQNFSGALQCFSKLAVISRSNNFDNYSIIAQSYSAICHAQLGHKKEALELSRNAIAELISAKYISGGKQDIYLNHAKVLRANQIQETAIEYIEKAYYEIKTIANRIQDPEYFKSFTEDVQVNAEIFREYNFVTRSSIDDTTSISTSNNLRSLYEVSKKINSVLDLSELLESIMDGALEVMHGERGMIFLIENNELVLRTSRNVEKETIKDATEISLSILRDVITGGKPIIISDTSKDNDSKKRESVINFNIHSIMCVPMKSKENIIGTVYVDNRSDILSAMSFSEIDVEFLEAFANLATIAIENARLHTRLQEENLYLKKEVNRQYGFENIVGTSNAMEKLFRETQSAIHSEDTVFIYGESGTGKELIARAIHYNSSRKDRRFVAIDCGAVQDTLLESELFGYKRGAFTGAVMDKRGLFEEAHNGTLFLDEIGNTSLSFQAKLLRVLQEGEFRRVGDTVTRHADVRVIAATNTDIQKQISDGLFRQDLFYRLNVIPLRIPALRERRDDIPLLVQHFVHAYNAKNGTAFKGVTTELIEILQRHTWQGNVRELENLINRMLVQSESDTLSTRNLPGDYSLESHAERTEKTDMSIRISSRIKTLREIEQEHILEVLSHCSNNKTEAAKLLGLKRTTLVEKMKKLGLM